jgi:hypothetical protein
LPSGQQKSIRELFGEDNPGFRRSLIEKIKADRRPTPSTNDLNVWEIGQCIRNHSADCKISLKYNSSTIVLTGEGTTAQTSFHTFRESLLPKVYEDLRNGLSMDQVARSLYQTVIPAFVYNSDGHLIGTPENLTVQVEGLTGPQMGMLAHGSNSIPAYMDGMKLRFSKKIGSGVKISAQKSKLDESVVMLGYPDKTDQHWGANGSDGQSLYCTIGKVITPQDWSARLKKAGWPYDFDQLSAYEKYLYQTNAVLTSTVSMSGMSGGPILNAKGELIAVHSSGSNELNSPATANTALQGGP